MYPGVFYRKWKYYLGCGFTDAERLCNRRDPVLGASSPHLQCGLGRDRSFLFLQILSRLEIGNHTEWGSGNIYSRGPGRTVDLPESLSQNVEGIRCGQKRHLFATRNGRPVSQRFVLRTLHQVAGKVGPYSFRRFRASILRKNRVPEDRIGMWLGHSDKTITDLYVRQLREDIPFRQERGKVWIALSVA